VVLLCLLSVALVSIPAACTAPRQGQKIRGLEYTRLSDEIYGRKHGTALTMDVIFPVKQNGAAVIYAVSSGFHSHHKVIEHPFFAKNIMGILLNRGYTVFAVIHGSTPKFTIRENYADIRRSIRFIRHNAKSYGIDPNRIGISGASAGGVISLMMGAAPQEGNPYSRDPVQRESTRLQAVGCFYPASDLVNFYGEGRSVLKVAADHKHSESYKFRDFDPKTDTYTPITDPKKILELLREHSPITHVTSDDAPMLIVHGDQDKLVPLLQASKMIDSLQAVGVKAKLVVAKGKGHGWGRMWKNEFKHIADWFDVHLVPAGTALDKNVEKKPKDVK
jgi:acetyl esterase/lipase